MPLDKLFQDIEQMNTMSLALIIFIAAAFHTIFGMDTPSSDTRTLLTEPLLKTMLYPRKKNINMELHFLSKEGQYHRVTDTGRINSSVTLSLQEFEKIPHNPCTMNISSEGDSYGINLPSGSVCIENFGLTSEQFETISSKKNEGGTFMIWDGKNRFDITKVEETNKSFKEEFSQAEEYVKGLNRLLQQTETSLLNETNHIKEMEQKLDVANKNLKEIFELHNISAQKLTITETAAKKLEESIKKLEESNNQLAAENKQLNEKKNPSKEERDHYQKIARDNTFLKAVVGLALLGILCNYFDVASKIMTSFALN